MAWSVSETDLKASYKVNENIKTLNNDYNIHRRPEFTWHREGKLTKAASITEPALTVVSRKEHALQIFLQQEERASGDQTGFRTRCENFVLVEEKSAFFL